MNRKLILAALLLAPRTATPLGEKRAFTRLGPLGTTAPPAIIRSYHSFHTSIRDQCFRPSIVQQNGAFSLMLAIGALLDRRYWWNFWRKQKDARTPAVPDDFFARLRDNTEVSAGWVE